MGRSIMLSASRTSRWHIKWVLSRKINLSHDKSCVMTHMKSMRHTRNKISRHTRRGVKGRVTHRERRVTHGVIWHAWGEYDIHQVNVALHIDASLKTIIALAVPIIGRPSFLEAIFRPRVQTFMICANSEPKCFPIFTHLSEAVSTFAGLQWTGSTPADSKKLFVWYLLIWGSGVELNWQIKQRHTHTHTHMTTADDVYS